MVRPVRLLLISPRHPESFWSFRWATEHVLKGKRALNPPLGLATLAALCPLHWQVTIVDENIESIPLNPEADIIGICGMGVQFNRQKELLKYYRDLGHFTVAGGSYASLCPEEYEGLVDVVVAGESEYIWPTFCKDFESDTALPLYRETGSVELADSPTPRFDLLNLDRYTSATVQFSRGCPYLCDFCDIIVMFGRRPRFKSHAQVQRELDILRLLGARSVFFVDDNLIGNRAVARDLLQFLRDYQIKYNAPFRFGTEVSLNLAQDSELLGLFHEAGFGWLFIGIESSDPETLKATRKSQNLREDVLTSVHRIQAQGIDVLAGFIIGFDQDTPQTFEHQYRCIMDSGIQAAMVGLLMALPRTPLYERLKQEGRLIESAPAVDNTRPRTNVVPKNMSATALIESYEALYRKLFSDASIAARVRDKTRRMGLPRFASEYSMGNAVRILVKLFAKGIAPGGVPRIVRFLGSLPWGKPKNIPAAVTDWICGLSMRDYIERHFGERPTDTRALRPFSQAFRRLTARYGAAHSVTMAIEHGVGTSLCIELRDQPDVHLIRRLAAQVDHLLRQTRVSVSFKLSGMQAAQILALEKLLQRLSRYGERIAVDMDERLSSKLPVDSSVFRLVLSRSESCLPSNHGVKIFEKTRWNLVVARS